MNPFVTALIQLKNAVSAAKLSPEILEILSTPERIIELSLSVKMDNGKVKVFKGFRVQYNNWLGPYKGGLRYHSQVDMNEVKALSFWMMIKNSVVNVPFGGGKGGIEVNPKELSKNELERLTRRFSKALTPNIGPYIDVPAPDVNTNSQILDWFVSEYIKGYSGQRAGNRMKKNELLAVATGKSIKNGGSEGREEATGLGGFYVLEELLKKLKFKGELTAAVQGFGNVGSYIARLISESGIKVVAVSDSKGGIYNSDGLDISEVDKVKSAGGKVQELTGKKITNEELLELPVDILIPAALEGVLTEKNAGKVKAKIVFEMANGPTNASADKIFKKRKIVVVPDVLANSGGVTVSYFEWLQNIKGKKWTKEKVEKELKQKIVEAFLDVWKTHLDKKVDLRTAAYVVALKRLVERFQIN